MSIFNYNGITNPGKDKEINEDYFECFEHKNVLFLIVADGMGGKEGTVFASAIAVNEIKRHIERNMVNDSVNHLKQLIDDGVYWANRILLAFKIANEQLYSGFATTLTLCAINKNKDVVIYNIGNSRLYILRSNNLIQMTKDDTIAQQLLDQNKITKEQFLIHPDRCILTKALGVTDNVSSNAITGKLVTNDILCLLSDGVFNMLSEVEIQRIILAAGDSKQSCDWLVEGANERGGIDNISSILSYIAF